MTTAERITENNKRQLEIIQALAKFKGVKIEAAPFGRMTCTLQNGIVLSCSRRDVVNRLMARG